MRVLFALCALAVASTPADAGDALFDAISAGDKAAVEQALAGGADVDSRARDQGTPSSLLLSTISLSLRNSC